MTGVAALAADLAAGRTTSEAATRAMLARIAARDGRLHAFIHLAAGAALQAASDSDCRRARGAALGVLDGVPLAAKGNIAVAGLPNTAGLGRATPPAAADAACVRALRDAGAVLLGTLNMHEAALGGTTDNPWFGRCANPLDETCVPGGSSGGSAAAVAAGFCAAALGTDTMGSVRLPASYCGVYGLKPTHGLIDATGVVALCERLDAVGLLAPALADLTALLSVLTSATAKAPVRRVAVPAIARSSPLQPAVRDALEQAVRALMASDVAVGSIDVPNWDPTRTRRAGLLLCEAEGAARFGVDGPGLSAGLTALLRYGAAAGPERIARAEAMLAAAAAGFDAASAGFGAVLLPTTPQRAFRHGDTPPADQADFTAIANITGRPAVSIPVWTAGESLPAAVQLIGQRGGEADLLALASVLDAALGNSGARLARNAR